MTGSPQTTADSSRDAANSRATRGGSCQTVPSDFRTPFNSGADAHGRMRAASDSVQTALDNRRGKNARVVPGAPDLSALLYRMRSRRPSSQMRPLGTVVPDAEAVTRVTQWIAELHAEAPRSPIIHTN